MTPTVLPTELEERTNEQEIITYYDDCQIDYEIVWHLKSRMCMHYGYWGDTTRRLRDALTNMNRKVAEFARIAPGERVLDAGCGVGGTSIFLARQYKCETIGITLSEKQVHTATSNADRHGAGEECRFERQNYLATTFPDNSFDVVLGIESICYAYDKGDFLREAFRILKPGGRVMIADFFSNQVTPGTAEADLMQQWTSTWAIKSYADVNEFWQALADVGFVNRRQRDVTDRVLKSIRRLHYSFFPGIIISKLLQAVGIRNQTQTNNTWSTHYQYKAYQQNLWQYRFYCAEKPTE